jgi:F0F1-type ATP synthase assembly protein I
MWRLSGMGFELASHIVAGVLLGLLGDYIFNTRPVLLIVGTIAGVIVGLAEFLRSALKAQRKYTHKPPPPGEIEEPHAGDDDRG